MTCSHFVPTCFLQHVFRANSSQKLASGGKSDAICSICSTTISLFLVCRWGEHYHEQLRCARTCMHPLMCLSIGDCPCRWAINLCRSSHSNLSGPLTSGTTLPSTHTPLPSTQATRPHSTLSLQHTLPCIQRLLAAIVPLLRLEPHLGMPQGRRALQEALPWECLLLGAHDKWQVHHLCTNASCPMASVFSPVTCSACLRVAAATVIAILVFSSAASSGQMLQGDFDWRDRNRKLIS